MENLHTLETQVLIEMLAKQTAQLMAKITGKEPRDAAPYEHDLVMIQAELNARLKPKDNTTITDIGTGLSSSMQQAAVEPDLGS